MHMPTGSFESGIDVRFGIVTALLAAGLLLTGVRAFRGGGGTSLRTIAAAFSGGILLAVAGYVGLLFLVDPAFGRDIWIGPFVVAIGGVAGVLAGILLQPSMRAKSPDARGDEL
jgi:hypothetical protein